MSIDTRNDDAATTRIVTTATTGRSVAVVGNRIDSRDLFSSDREIIIAHGEGDYRLRLTSQNKLILTK